MKPGETIRCIYRMFLHFCRYIGCLYMFISCSIVIFKPATLGVAARPVQASSTSVVIFQPDAATGETR